MEAKNQDCGLQLMAASKKSPGYFPQGEATNAIEKERTKTPAAKIS
jgi:hypothetical protein